MTDATRVRCLGDELAEYAAGRLPLHRQWAWDRHLVTCRTCGHALTQERRLTSALAGAPTMPGDLRSTLLALGSTMAAELAPRAATPAPQDPLRLLAPSAPPCHRSPLRATVVAAAAAGVSAAAAWSLTVVPAPATVRPALATTATPVVSPSAAPVRGVTAVATVPNGLGQAVVLTRLGQQAQSSP
jgi:hypothetical protein